MKATSVDATSEFRTNMMWVAAAVALGIWLPLRELYFATFHWSDLLIESICAALYLPLLLEKFRAWQKSHGDDGADQLAHVESHFVTATDTLMAVPWAGLVLIFAKTAIPALLLIKLLALPRVLRVRRALDLVGNLHPVLSRLIPLAFIVPLTVHLVACGWIWLGSGTAGPSDDKVFEYGRAVYWAITTLATVGYGDISAKTLPQMAFASLTMVVGVGFFGYVLSNVASLLARLDAARESYLNVLDNVEAFMRTNVVPTEVRTRVRSYFNYLWETRRGLDHSDVMSMLPTNLRSEIALHLSAGIIRKVPLLKDADPDVLSDIVLELLPRVAVPGEKIFHVGEAGDAMYFLHNGQVEIKSKDDITIATLNEGSFFGEMALITKNTRSATAIATNYCDLFVLSREGFLKVMHRYPSFEAKIRSHVDRMLESKKIEPVRQAV
jgi:hypothetical protein